MSSFVIISKFCYSQQGSHSMNTKRPKLLFGSHETSPIARTGDTVLVESREMTGRREGGEKGQRRQKTKGIGFIGITLSLLLSLVRLRCVSSFRFFPLPLSVLFRLPLSVFFSPPFLLRTRTVFYTDLYHLIFLFTYGSDCYVLKYKKSGTTTT